jgi:signal transduction histidine kinase
MVGTEQPPQAPLIRRRRLLLHGESVIASAGIVLAAVLLSLMAGLAWWTVRTERRASENARIEQIKTLGFVLAQSAQVMLEHDELSPLRRLVSETASKYELTVCKVTLSDGTVVAAPKLPANWDRVRLLDDALPPEVRGQTAVALHLTIQERGEADVEVAGPISHPPRSGWETQTGVGAFGAVAMIALLFVYRHMRSRVRALGAIREALLAIDAGEKDASILQVSTELGAEAKAWNEVIAAREKLRRQDVAERAKEVLGQRGETRSDLVAACDAMSHGLLLVDGTQTVTYANGAAAVFLRTRKEELLGGTIDKHLHVDNVLQAIRDVAGGAVRRRTVMDVERKDDGPGGAGFSVRPVRRDDAASAMVTIEDITQQKVAEEARHAFVAHTTHELRTPLTNIRLYVETAIDEGEANPATRAKCLNVINGETRRLERIVGEMLSMAEIEAGSLKLKPDDVRLETLFDELKADYQQQAIERQIDLQLKLPPKLPVLRGDRDKIVLALHNLMGNALKYTPEGGKVTITVEVDNRQISVSISDTGIGISAEDAERIFERFYRAKDPRVAKITGTGLGLTLAREVVRMHGGDITVESQLDQGSTFTMTLPLKAAA